MEDDSSLDFARVMAASVREVIVPYFEKYFPRVPDPGIFIDYDGLPDKSFMSVLSPQANVLFVTKEHLDHIIESNDRDDKIYNTALFLQGIIHELVHLVQPPHVFDGGYDEWLEGAAHAIGSLIAHDFYKDAESEFLFWFLGRSTYNMPRAIRDKRVRIGLERVFASYYALNYFALDRMGVPYNPPDFFSGSIKKLSARVISLEDPCCKPLFRTGTSGLRTIYRIFHKKEIDNHDLERILSLSRGRMVIERLLQDGHKSGEIIANPIDDGEMLRIFEEIRLEQA